MGADGIWKVLGARCHGFQLGRGAKVARAVYDKLRCAIYVGLRVDWSGTGGVAEGSYVKLAGRGWLGWRDQRVGKVQLAFELAGQSRSGVGWIGWY